LVNSRARLFAARVTSLIFMLAGCAEAGFGASPPLPAQAPRTEGMSPTRLQQLNDFFAGEAERQSAAGYVLAVARHGKLVDAAAVGYRDIEHRVPMSLDTRFRIASMSKPVTSVAVLMLYEEGRFHLDDPIKRWLPEFAQPRVYTGVDADGNLQSEPAKRDITIRDLLTHSSGLGYLFDYQTPLGKAWLSLKIDRHASLAEGTRQIASLPLYFSPGEGWQYSYAHDVLGRLVEVVAGMPFQEFLKERLFTPLKMNSTGFYLTPETVPLLATMYVRGADGALQTDRAAWLAQPDDSELTPSGGGGLISTAGDYLRFAQMLANGGSLEGHQVLSPVTVALMTHNQVPVDAMQKFWGADSVGLGFGLGVGVEVDASHAPQAGYDGDYEWGGVFDTHWLVSPRTGLVAVLLAQIDPSGNKHPQRTDVDFRNLLFAAVAAD
jgi:CubicO group peptidase (beta-lactamase class C family)